MHDAISASPEQIAIGDAILQLMMMGGPRRHLMVEAVAGAGKTRTLVNVAEHVLALRPAVRILLLAFNVEMVATLRERLVAHPNVDVSTVHALGLRLCNEGLPHMDDDPQPAAKRRRIQVDVDKACRCWSEMVAGGACDNGEDWNSAWWTSLRTELDHWRQQGRPILPDTDPSTQHPRSAVEALLARMVQDRGTVDQEDQLWPLPLPAR